MVEAYSMHVGHHDPETYEIIDLINGYLFPVDFFQWISEGLLVTKTIYEDFAKDKYSKIDQFFIGNALVFTYKSEFDLKKFSKSAIQNLTQKKAIITNRVPGLEKLCRHPMTKLSTELHYSVVSHLHNQEELAGFSWEIFELKRLIPIYANLNDPLRHWRQH